MTASPEPGAVDQPAPRIATELGVPPLKSFTLNQSRRPITAYCGTFAIAAGFITSVAILVLMSLAGPGRHVYTPFFALAVAGGAR